MTSILLLGMIVGLSVAAPIGPINLLCVRRTLAHGPALGLVSGLGSAVAHVAYSALPALGFSAISSLLLGQQFWLRLIGGFILAYLGVKTLASKTLNPASGPHERGLLAAFGSSCALTLSNPMTIVSFAAAFTGLNLTSSQGQPGLFAGGVFLGSVLWRAGLCLATSGLRSKLSPPVLAWVNRSAGLALAGFGVLALVNAFAARSV